MDLFMVEERYSYCITCLTATSINSSLLCCWTTSWCVW